MTVTNHDTPTPRGRTNLLGALSSRLLTVFLLYLGVGLGHHLFLEARFQWNRLLDFDQRDNAAANMARRPLQTDVEETLVDLTIGGKSCTAVPLRNTELLVTAGHCVVDDAVQIVEPGTLLAAYRKDGALQEDFLGDAEILVHPRYLETARATPLNGVQRMLLSALTWSTIRGADRDASPYTWDVAVIRTPGRTWSIGVDGLTTSRADTYLVEAYQNFTIDGVPVCTLDIPENCPQGTLPSETVEQYRHGVRCAVKDMGKPAQVDGWFPCALMPGGSGGAVLVARDGRLLLLGLVTGGDPFGEGNGITVDAIAPFVEPLLPG